MYMLHEREPQKIHTIFLVLTLRSITPVFLKLKIKERQS